MENYPLGKHTHGKILRNELCTHQDRNTLLSKRHLGSLGVPGSSLSLRNLKAIQLVIRLYADFSNFLHIVFNKFKSLKHKNICRTWAQWLIPVILGD